MCSKYVEIDWMHQSKALLAIDISKKQNTTYLNLIRK